jgi:2,3-bisphosphoglycerate-independent phosphoglycerate mutase
LNSLTSPSVIFVFLDGLGVGPADETNPLWLAPMSNFRRLLSGPLVVGRNVDRPGLLFRGIDALLGVPGLPQSATGQTALFTGVNAAQLLGQHLGAYPNAQLTEVINEHNILKRATERGYRATFANAYTPQYFQLVKKRKRRHSATTLSVLAAGLPFRTLEDLQRGEAVYWDITHFYLVEHLHVAMPVIEPEIAGQRLARLSRNYDLVLYESFLPDAVGHRRDLELALEILDVLDRFFAGLLEEIGPTVTVVMSSDHGNLEEIGLRLHSTNPVPLLVVGPGAGSFRQAQFITDVAGGIMRVLEQGPLPQPLSQPWEKGVRGMRAINAKTHETFRGFPVGNSN